MVADPPPTWVAVAVAAVVVGVASGWFLVSWGGLHARATDAAGESVGVALGLLVVMSIVGAVRSRGRRDG